MVSTTRPLTASTKPATELLFSIVIPVFNSEEILPTTITRVVSAMNARGWRFELVLVNDGSSDGSWEIVRHAAGHDSRIVGVDLIKNYGQHNANLCGLRHTTGDYVITMDDDLQNPPEEIEYLVAEALRGHDVVFGRFDRKKAAWYRSLGSKAIGSINRRVFAQPPTLTVSNFRILDRRVVDRICQARTAFPYITGQALLYSSHPSNADVRHDARPVGSSHYNLVRIISLVLRILFSYSVAPFRIVAGGRRSDRHDQPDLRNGGGGSKCRLRHRSRGVDLNSGSVLIVEWHDDPHACNDRRIRRAHPPASFGFAVVPREGSSERRGSNVTPADGYLFVVGAQRCGTSLLRSLLDDHPDIEMAKPFRPEPKWFLKQDRRPGIDQFNAELFTEVAVRWRGEKATSYLESGGVAAILCREVPECRAIIVLREPVARAVSNYSYSVSNGVETRPIDEALSPDALEPDWDPAVFSVSPFGYLRRSKYIDFVRPYVNEFGNRLNIVLFDDLVSGVALGPLLDWLGLDAPSEMAPAQVNSSERSDAVPDSLRAELADFYATPNAELSELLDLDLSRWATVEGGCGARSQ